MTADDSGHRVAPAGFIETFRSVLGKPLLWEYHQRRIRTACERSQIAVPTHFLVSDLGLLHGEMTRLLAEDRLNDGVFRYAIHYDEGAHQPTETLEIRALPKPDPKEGIELHVLRQRRDRGPWVPRPKSLDYENTLSGLKELRGRTQDEFADGLFLDADHAFVAEATYRNVGWIRDGQVFCPAPELGAVAGTCLEWLGDKVVPLKPVCAPLEDLLAAEVVFLCNSVRGITRVRTIRDQGGLLCATYSTAPHPLISRLEASWHQICPTLRGSNSA